MKKGKILKFEVDKNNNGWLMKKSIFSFNINLIWLFFLILLFLYLFSENSFCETLIENADKIPEKKGSLEVNVKKVLKFAWKTIKFIDDTRRWVGFDINTILLIWIIWLMSGAPGYEGENDDDEK